MKEGGGYGRDGILISCGDIGGRNNQWFSLAAPLVHRLKHKADEMKFVGFVLRNVLN